MKQMLPFKYLIAAFLYLSLGLILPASALAGDVVFLERGAAGLKPPGGMIAHRHLPLFYDDEEKAMILVKDSSLLVVDGSTQSPDKPFSDYGKIDDIPSGVRMEGPVQHLKLAGGIEAYLFVYTEMKQDIAIRNWLMFARSAELFAEIFATASADSKIYTDATMQVALQSLQFREPQPWE